MKPAPYHPAANGMAERFVQALEQALRAALTEKKTISRKLTNFFLAYRTTQPSSWEETSERDSTY